MDAPPRRDTALLTGALALALSFTPSLLERRRGDQAKISAAAVVLGAAAGAASEVAVVRLAARLRGGEPSARTALAAGALAAAALRLPAHRRSEVALLGTGAIVAGTSALLGAVAPVKQRTRRPRDPRVAAYAALSAACFVIASREANKRGPRARLAEYPAERRLDTVSGGAGSLLPRAELDFEGTRFIGTALPAEQIERITGARASDPIRVFAGMRCAGTPEERARLAVDELARLGAFQRARILVCSATLRGYVNPVPVQAEEAFAAGDVASVTVQYWDRPTPAMPLKVPVAARTHRALLSELARRTAGERAEIAVYGESLGAWASQNVFRRDGTRALDSLRVTRALWAGTPFFSRLPRLMRRGKVPSDARVGELSTRELLEQDPHDAARLRFVFLARSIDPVVAFSGLELLWRRPTWLPEQRWIPGITFLQMVADLLRATRWTSDVPQAAAHDYRIELPLAVNVALGHHVARDRAMAIADRLVELEIARGALLKALRRGRPAPPPSAAAPASAG